MTDLEPYKLRVNLALGTFLRKSKYATVADAQKAIVDFLMVYLSISPGFEVPMPPDVGVASREPSHQISALRQALKEARHYMANLATRKATPSDNVELYNKIMMDTKIALGASDSPLLGSGGE